MYELRRLRSDHETAVLDFEVANRTYFALSINDRGDEFFEEFTKRHDALMADQVKGVVACYVLVDEDENVMGRFNLYDMADGTADVGYRVAQQVAGHGVATAALRQLCRLARDEHGLSKLQAATSTGNVGSQRVLEKVGFVAIGPTDVVGRPGLSYEIALTDL